MTDPVDKTITINPLAVVRARRDARSTFTKGLDFVLESAIRVLGSRVMFSIALILPLISLLPGLVWSQKLILILSSTWIQWWALHALQRSQIKGDKLREIKAAADHEALEHIAGQVDLLVARNA